MIAGQLPLDPDAPIIVIDIGNTNVTVATWEKGQVRTPVSCSIDDQTAFDDAFDGLPVFASDGQRLMWTSKRGSLEEAQVFIADFKRPAEFE